MNQNKNINTTSIRPGKQSSDNPSFDDPSLDNPSLDNPSLDNPSLDNPSLDNPSLDNPSFDNPSLDNPSLDNPSFDRRPFIALELSLDLVRAVRPLVERIQRCDPGLARQVRDALTGIPGHLGEANRRVGRDRAHLFRVVIGSTDEVRIGLRTAEAMGYLRLEDLGPSLALADRVVAIAWRLKTGTRAPR